MTTTTSAPPRPISQTRERFSDILAVQRAAYLRVGAPTLANAAVI